MLFRLQIRDAATSAMFIASFQQGSTSSIVDSVLVTLGMLVAIVVIAALITKAE